MGEIGRKSVHMAFGTLFILCAVFFGGFNTLLVAVAALAGGVTISYMMRHGLDFPVFSLAVELFERDYEKHYPGKGAILFFLGSIVLIYLALFVLKSEAIIAPALVPVVFGDGIATIAGVKWGKHKITHRKSAEGTAAGFIATAIVLGAFFLPSWGKILAVSASAMLVELLPLDDNLTIPIVSGLVLYIII